METVGNRPSTLQSILRVLVIWGISAVAIIIMGFLLDGVQIESIGVAIAGAVAIGLLNALL